MGSSSSSNSIELKMPNIDVIFVVVFLIALVSSRTTCSPTSSSSSSSTNATTANHHRHRHGDDGWHNVDLTEQDLHRSTVSDNNDAEVVSEELYDGSGYSSNCSHCGMREETRRFKLELIKQDILKKLKLEAPPNITISAKRIPVLTELLEEYEMQGDAPHGHHHHMNQRYDNDDYAVTDAVTNFAKPRKLNCIYFSITIYVLIKPFQI